MGRRGLERRYAERFVSVTGTKVRDQLTGSGDVAYRSHNEAERLPYSPFPSLS